MLTKKSFSKIGFILLSLALVLAILAATLPQRQAQAATTPGTITAWAEKGKIYVKLSGFTQKYQLRLKVRDALQGIGGWKPLGTVKVDRKTGDVTNVFPVPKSLINNLYLNVCMKNMTTNILTCKVVVNPGPK